ncbi:MAG: hypothetical protein ABMA25_19375, partial [Ilumatobacteraceae bacterium]
MFSTTTLARTATFAAALAVAPFALGGHADAALSDLTFAENVSCSPLGISADIHNSGDTDEVVSIAMNTNESAAVTSNLVVKANASASYFFPLSDGERVDTIQFRDAQHAVVETLYVGKVVSSGGSCERTAIDQVDVTGYSLTCSNGTMHASLLVANNGDYTHQLMASASSWFDTDEEWNLAEQHNFLGAHDTMQLAPGESHAVELDFQVVDMVRVGVTDTDGQKVLFDDGPRALAGAELACQHDFSIVTGEESAPAVPAT